MQFRKRFHPRSIRRIIRCIRSVAKNRKSFLCRSLRHCAEHLFLAYITAVRGIRGNFRHGQHINSDHIHWNVQFLCQPQRILIFELRLKYALNIIGANAASITPGGIKQIGGVHTAGKSNCNVIILFEKRFQFHRIFVDQELLPKQKGGSAQSAEPSRTARLTFRKTLPS